MGDYFLEPSIGWYNPYDQEPGGNDEWDGDDGQAALAEDHYFNNTIEGLRQDRDVYKAKVEALQEKFVATDAILRTMQIDDEHRAKLQALGYLSEVVF